MYFELCAVFSNCGFELRYLCVNVISADFNVYDLP